MSGIELDITPVGKPRMTQSDKWKKRPATERYWNFKDALNSMIRVPSWSDDDILSLTFIIPMPKSWSEKKKQQMDGAVHRVKPDMDNCVKAFKDAVFEDDAVVHTYGPMKKRWGREGKIIIY